MGRLTGSCIFNHSIELKPYKDQCSYATTTYALSRRGEASSIDSRRFRLKTKLRSNPVRHFALQQAKINRFEKSHRLVLYSVIGRVRTLHGKESVRRGRYVDWRTSKVGRIGM